MPDSPFQEHPSRLPGWTGRLPRLLLLALASLLYHHFTYRGSLSDAQWAYLNVDGIELGTPQDEVRSCRDYLHYDQDKRVRYISGRELRLHDGILLSVGDEITSAREILGQPRIVQETSGSVYYYYRRGPLTVACARGPRQRISQISLQKSERKTR